MDPMSAVLKALAGSSTDTDVYLQHFSNVDWASTSLGPTDTWPEALALLFHLAMLEPEPRVLLLGEESLMLYNTAYGQLIGNKHPAGLGRLFFDVWSDYPEYVAYVVATSTTGKLQDKRHFSVSLTTNGYLEERHVSWTTKPLPSTSKSALSGYYVSVKDETAEHIAQKRASALQSLTVEWSAATTLPSLWQACTESLSARDYDFPFALLYASEQDAGHSHHSMFDGSDKSVLRLQGLAGEFDIHGPVHDPLHLQSEEQSYGRLLSQAMSSEQPILLCSSNGPLPKIWTQAARNRGYRDECASVAMIPMRSNGHVRGLLIIGLHTRIRRDEANQTWISDLSKVLASAIESVLVLEKARRKEQNAAEVLALRETQITKYSEKYLRMLKVVEIADVGIFDADVPGGELLFANNAWYNLSGCPQDLSTSEPYPWLNLVFEQDQALVMANWRAMLRDGLPANYEFRWKARDDPEGRWILASCLPIVNEQGVVTSVTGSTVDISAQKRVEKDALERARAVEKLRATEQRFLRYLDNAPMAVGIAEHPSGVLSYCNDTWFKLMGTSRSEVSQQDWRSVVFEEDIPIVQRICDAVIETQQPQTAQFRLKRMTDSAGQRHQAWAEGSFTAELKEDGSVRAVTAAMSDISHLKWAEIAQKSRVDEAIEAKRQQENFIDMTSHEIRNPLGAVYHCADSIFDTLSQMHTIIDAISKDDLKQGVLHELVASSVEAVDIIRECSAHQKRIVDDLLTLSKLDSKLLQINHYPVRVSKLLSSVHKMFLAESQREGITLNIQHDASLQAMQLDWAKLDSGRVQQILINLVTNAFKFTKQAKTRRVTMRMGVSTRRPSEEGFLAPVDFALARNLRDSIFESVETGPSLYLWFSVQDTGRGMSVEEEAKLFSKFSQGGPRTHSEYGGSGLGLFISRELAEIQGGEIGVSSRAGDGSTFAFYVRTHACTAPTASFALPARPSHTTPDPDKPVSSASKTSVLIVEDNMVNQRVLKQQLRKFGYEVWTADNGQEALDFLRTTRYWRDCEASSSKHVDVVLLDIEMPVLDGLSAARCIREMQLNGQIRGHIPIIAVSANARPEQTSQAIAAGMDDWVAKPFRIADLLPKIERLAAWAKALDR